MGMSNQQMPPELREYHAAAKKNLSGASLADTHDLMNVRLGIGIVCAEEGEGGFRPWLVQFGKVVRHGWERFIKCVRANADPQLMRDPKPSEAHWKTRCVGCNAELPPGRAGRKCAGCLANAKSGA